MEFARASHGCSQPALCYSLIGLQPAVGFLGLRFLFGALDLDPYRWAGRPILITMAAVMPVTDLVRKDGGEDDGRVRPGRLDRRVVGGKKLSGGSR